MERSRYQLVVVPSLDIVVAYSDVEVAIQQIGEAFMTRAGAAVAPNISRLTRWVCRGPRTPCTYNSKRRIPGARSNFKARQTKSVQSLFVDIPECYFEFRRK